MKTTSRYRLLALITAGAVALGGFPATAAAAAPAPAAEEVTLEGLLQVLPDETGETGGENTVNLVTDEGTVIQLTGDLNGAATGAHFSGDVIVTPEVAELVEQAPATDLEVAVADAAATLDAPLEVTDSTIIPVTARAATATQHTVDVMYISAPGGAKPTTANIDLAVGRLSEYWVSQSDGQVAGISRPNPVRFAEKPAAELCEPNALWTFAAGASGFNRGMTYYWAEGRAAHLIVIVPGSVCGAGNGLGTVGSVHAGGVSWASVAENDQTMWDQVIFHEVGHNLGLGHSNRASCDKPATDGATCKVQEYYDFYDVMGGGYNYGSYTNQRNVAALNVSQKANLDALPRTGGSKALATVTVTGGDKQEFTLSAASADTGLRGLEVLNQHTGEKYYVEYRSGTGRDAQSFYKQVVGNHVGYGPGVRVLKLACNTAPGCAGVTSTVQPSPTGNMYFTAGEQFTSVGTSGTSKPGARVEVISTSTGSAVIRVNYTEAVATGPIIRGNATVGQTLTAEVTDWPGTLSYQWKRAGTAIAGATKATYTLVPADSGKTITVTVTSNQGLTKTSAATPTVITPALPGSHGTVTIEGNVKEGSTLTAKLAGTPTGAATTYTWLVGGVSASTASTLTLTAAHVGKPVTVKVTHQVTGYLPATIEATTGPVAADTAKPMLFTVPKVTGTAKVGQKLTATAGTWQADAKLTGQWTVGGAAVVGATGTTFTVRPADIGKTVGYTVTGTLAGYATTVKSSAATAAVTAGTLTGGTPTISGTAKVGAALKAGAGGWTAGTKLTYQWMAGGKAIAGATGASYTPAAADAGKSFTVRVTGSQAGYSTLALNSKGTAVVAKGTLTVPKLTVTGAVRVGSAVTATLSGASTASISYTYQWTIAGKNVSGATKKSFTLRAADKGKAVAVKVTAAKAGYTSVAKSAAASPKVAAGVISAAAPKITGTPKVGKVLKVASVTGGFTVKYQWYSNGAKISGATKASFTPTSKHKGKMITVKVTYSKAAYTTVTKTSAAVKVS